MKAVFLKFLIFAFAVFIAFQSSGETKPGPVCDYTHCPYGKDNCCTQNGVTLYTLLP